MEQEKSVNKPLLIVIIGVSALAVVFFIGYSVGGIVSADKILKQISQKANNSGFRESQRDTQMDSQIQALPRAGGQGYAGSWIRQAMFIDGRLEYAMPMTLSLYPDSFQTIGSCNSGGALSQAGDTLTFLVNESDCTGIGPLPYTITYRYGLTEDKKM